METTDPAEALKAIMNANGWTQRQLGRELGGLSQGWVSSVLLGRRDPGIKRYAKYLGYVGWEVVIRPKKEDRVKRREFHENLMKVASAAIAGRAAGVFVGPAGLDNPYGDPDYVLGLARRAADMREQLGGVPLVPKIQGQCRGVGAVLSQGGKALNVAASEFSRQAAWVFHDVDRPDLAERFAGRALSLAVKGEDHERQAAAHATLCNILLTEMSPDRAAFHAAEGLKLPDVSEGYRAPLKAYMARAMSLNVQVPKRRSQKLIDQALAVKGISSLDSAWVQLECGHALRSLGEDQQALHAFGQSIQLSEPEQEAHALAEAAKTTLATQRLDHAAQLMKALSYVIPLVSSTRLDQKTKSVLQESAQWADSREIRHARELLVAATSQPTSTA